MKITAENTQFYLSSINSDKSRLGNKFSNLNLHDIDKKPHGIVLLGLADDTGVKNVGGKIGAALAPKSIREKLYRFCSIEYQTPLYDLGDLQASQSIEHTHEEATKLIEKIRMAGHVPIILGGGHDLAFPEALSLITCNPKKKINFLNIDAHLDLRDTNSGITSGSPWYLLHESKSFNPKLHTLVEFGIQEHCNAPQLFAYAKKHAIEIHPLHKLGKNRITRYKKILNKISKNPFLFSLDIDSIRNSEAPGCSAAQSFGFTAEEAVEFCAFAASKKNLKSFGIFEVSPPVDVNQQTALLAAHCVHAFLRGREEQVRVRI